LLLDAAEQRKGYGRAAVQKVIDELTAMPECQQVWIRYYPDNLIARRLYRSLGFVEVGEQDGQVLPRYSSSP
jgi:diamine N-acetyltransferase